MGIFLRFIPESVRWLLAKKKNRTAGKIVRKAAEVNGVVLSDLLRSTFDGDETDRSKASPNKKSQNLDIQSGLLQRINTCITTLCTKS
jgi:hypothetical protein